MGRLTIPASHTSNQGPTTGKGGEGAVREVGREDAPQEGREAEAEGEAKQDAQVLSWHGIECMGRRYKVLLRYPRSELICLTPSWT